MSNGLGRGLNSLIPNKTSPTIKKQISTLSPEESKGQIIEVEVNSIKSNPMQPRERFTDTKLEELAESIKEYGIIQPIVVSQAGDSYELIAGERRLRAGKLAGLEKIPAIIRDVDDQKKLELALIENIQRENLNPIDLAHAYQRLMSEFNLTQEEAAKHLGKSRPVIANTLRYLGLPEEIQLAMIEGKINEGHAKYLAGIEGEDRQLNLFRKIVRNGLTVSDTNKEAKKMGGTKQARNKEINYQDKDKEFAFREFFGAKVEIKRKGKGGQVIIDFFSDDELRGMIEKMKK